MGMFRDLAKLNKQAKEINKTWDVGQQLADAQASMAQANQFMAQQTAAATAAASGEAATATVTAIRGGHELVNMQPVVELDLTIMPAGGAPYPATAKQPVPAPLLPQVQPGCTIPVTVDPGDRTRVWIAIT